MSQAANRCETPRGPSPQQVRQRLDAILAERRYIGVRNIAADLLLEPRNPFQQMRRQPKKWVVAMIVLGALGFALIYAFHLR